MSANIEALVAKHFNPYAIYGTEHLDHMRNALTEQAETHAIELRAYEATVEYLTRERDEAVKELVNIRDATPSEWSDPTDFKAWAQSRAAHTIGRIAAVPQKKEPRHE